MKNVVTQQGAQPAVAPTLLRSPQTVQTVQTMPLQQPTLMNSTVQHPVQHPVQLPVQHPVQHGGQHPGQHPLPVTAQQNTNSHLLNNRHNELVPVQQNNSLLRGDRHLFSSSDDNVMMRQIQGTHAPDGREVNVKPLLHIVEDILHRATPSLDGVLAHEHVLSFSISISDTSMASVMINNNTVALSLIIMDFLRFSAGYYASAYGCPG